MKNFGLIGNPLSHSWSKDYFDHRFQDEHISDCSYQLYPLDSLDGLREFVSRHRLAGFNVTIPFKKAIIPLLDQLTPQAQLIGAVNCVKATQNGNSLHLVGHNTDQPAFHDTFAPLYSQLAETSHRTDHSALVLGNGGASQAVVFTLQQMGIPYQTLSHTDIDTMRATRALPPTIEQLPSVIINATPVGMYPNCDESPLPANLAHPSPMLVYDLVYNPAETRLLHDFSSPGFLLRNGLPMLHRQADLSWTFWNAPGN